MPSSIPLPSNTPSRPAAPTSLSFGPRSKPISYLHPGSPHPHPLFVTLILKTVLDHVFSTYNPAYLTLPSLTYQSLMQSHTHPQPQPLKNLQARFLRLVLCLTSLPLFAFKYVQTSTPTHHNCLLFDFGSFPLPLSLNAHVNVSSHCNTTGYHVS